MKLAKKLYKIRLILGINLTSLGDIIIIPSNIFFGGYEIINYMVQHIYGEIRGNEVIVRKFRVRKPLIIHTICLII